MWVINVSGRFHLGGSSFSVLVLDAFVLLPAAMLLNGRIDESWLRALRRPLHYLARSRVERVTLCRWMRYAELKSRAISRQFLLPGLFTVACQQVPTRVVPLVSLCDRTLWTCAFAFARCDSCLG